MDIRKLTIENIEGLEEGYTIDEYLYDQEIDDQISFALSAQGGY